MLKECLLEILTSYHNFEYSTLIFNSTCANLYTYFYYKGDHILL